MAALFNIGGETKTSKERVLKEVAKCQILCGTCHHIKTRAPITYQELRKKCGKEKEINLELFLNYKSNKSNDSVAFVAGR